MTHPSAQTLDALHLGALDANTRAATASHVDICTQCRARMQEAEASRRHFIEHVLPRLLPAIAPPRRRIWWLMPPVLAAAVAASMIFLRPAPEPASELGIKGAAALQLYANRGDRVMLVHDGISLQPGDRIRFVIKAAASQHLVIASIDAAGNATIYYPYGGDASVQLPDAPVHEVPGSVILDRTLGPERVFALVARAPISVEPVLAALRGVGARGPEAIRTQATLDLPVDAQLSIVFEKVKP